MNKVVSMLQKQPVQAKARLVEDSVISLLKIQNWLNEEDCKEWDGYVEINLVLSVSVYRAMKLSLFPLIQLTNSSIGPSPFLVHVCCNGPFASSK